MKIGPPTTPKTPNVNGYKTFDDEVDQVVSSMYADNKEMCRFSFQQDDTSEHKWPI